MKETQPYDLVCIGSGPAGQRGAVQAAKLGKRVAVVERRRTVGGVCLDTGTIPSKTFREAVLSLKRRTPFERAGRPNGVVQAEELLSRVTEVVASEERVIADQLARNDIEVVRGSASFLDPHRLLVRDGDLDRVLTTDNVLIAVGTRPAPPPGVPVDGETIITSDEMMQLKRVPHLLVVVGAGVIGLEYASMFASLGTEVTLVDRQRRPLEFLDDEIVDELLHQLRGRNVLFRGEETVHQLDIHEGPPRRAVVQLDSGKRLVADLVLFSIGRIGATDELNLAAAGLSADARGRLVVNERFQTAVPHIYAAGDVLGYPSLAATSSEQGRIAACHAMGHEAKPLDQHFPIGIYAIPEASMAGATEGALTREKIPYEVGIARYREIARGQILGDDSGFLKLLFHRESRLLLGVHIVGTGATELVHIGQAVLALGGGLDYFLDAVFNYPTLAECYKVAAFDANNKLSL